MARISSDQSTAIRCPKHGHRMAAMFVRPEKPESFQPFYTCLHCLIAMNILDESVPAEVALTLPRLR